VQGGDGGRLTCPPWGLVGGGSGAVATTLVKAPGDTELHVPRTQPIMWPAGTEVLYMTAGGGGWGDPVERDPERVLHDVREEYISEARASEQYGVVLTAGRAAVDAAATAALRREMRARKSRGAK
jgi:N-methylhydantoinase B